MIWKHKSSHLNSLNTVSVVTEQPRDGITSDLLQLLQSEAAWPSSILVPEPIPMSQVVELSPNDAGEGLTQQTSRNWILSNASTEQFHVVRSVIQSLIGRNCSVGHQASQLVPTCDWLEATEFTITKKEFCGKCHVIIFSNLL